MKKKSNIAIDSIKSQIDRKCRWRPRLQIRFDASFYTDWCFYLHWLNVLLRQILQMHFLSIWLLILSIAILLFFFILWQKDIRSETFRENRSYRWTEQTEVDSASKQQSTVEQILHHWTSTHKIFFGGRWNCEWNATKFQKTQPTNKLLLH